MPLHSSGLPNEIRIPGLAHSGRLRKLRRWNWRQLQLAAAALNYTMNAFGAAVAGDSESRDTRLHTKTVDLFVDRHQREDVVDPLLRRQLRIKKRIFVLLAERWRRKECNELALPLIREKEPIRIFISHPLPLLLNSR